MFISIFNISFGILFGLHHLGFLNIPDKLRLILGILFILTHILNFFIKKAVNKKLDSKNDDFFVYSDKPLKPLNPSSDAKKFMEDLNKYVKDKEKVKIKR